MRSDEELMEAHVAGDATAFAELFERYAPVLLRAMARQLHTPEEARDLVQQTFLQLHRARNDFRLGAKLRPWLFTIAFNLKREHFRRTARRREALGPLHADQEPSQEPLDPVTHDQVQALKGALAQLPRAHREVIELHWFDGLSFAEVAPVVGASVNAVKVRAHRGYRRLRTILGETESAANRSSGSFK
ncbi:MAG TPA: RNA polymerase sigma factor [Polyangiaceae bacterium]